MLTDVALVFSAVSLSTAQSDLGVNLLGLECFPVVNNLYHSRMMDFKSSDFIIFSDSNNCFFKIIADISPPWHCVTTHLNAAHLPTAKTSAFIEVLTLAEDQLLQCI